MRHALLPLFLLPLALCAAQPPPSVFDATPAWPAPFAPRLKPADPASEILRHLTVEERVGEPRTDELVRVPIFLHADEPNDPTRWALYAATDGARLHPIVFQIDDIRRDATGQLTRCHLHFSTTLAPWERRRFTLVRHDTPVATAAPPPVPSQHTGDRVTFVGDDLAVTFLVSGPHAGTITGLAPLGRAIALPDGGIAPALTLVRQAADCSVLRHTEVSPRTPGAPEVRDLRWGSGPLFAKLAVRLGPPGLPDSAEFIYRVPRRGAELLQTERLAPDGEPTAEAVGADAHRLLAGRLLLGAAADTMETVRVPAGLRRLTRATTGHFLDALVDRTASLALLPVPSVQTGGGEISLGRGGAVAIAGSPNFRRTAAANSATLRAFWGEMRYAFSSATDEESLWHLARRRFQPLVASVDEPAIGPADCRAAMPAIAERFQEIKYWGRNWVQDAAILQLHRDHAKLDALLAKRPGAEEADPAFHLPQWARTTPPQPRNPKDQGRIDPYHLAYGSSVMPLLALETGSERLPVVARAIGRATHDTFGRVDVGGFPYVDCFATAFNMQLGPLGLALCGGRPADDPGLATWARDALRAPGATAIYGHGQRPYPGVPGRPEPSDFLYESICDFHLRSLELATGEDLQLHPAALTRYLDCIDVTADLQHRALPGTPTPSWWRANFFRGQAHDHRWELWSCAPFTALFARAGDRGESGATEATYWLDEQGRRPQPWAELMWFAHADLLLALRDHLPPAVAAPPPPAAPHVRRERNVNHVRWSPVAGAVGYRIYRAARMGGPWAWLNSPYATTPGEPVVDTAFADPAGRESDVYFVTAVDSAGRESRWYPEEPGPR